jgi:hypothetical protein
MDNNYEPEVIENTDNKDSQIKSIEDIKSSAYISSIDEQIKAEDLYDRQLQRRMRLEVKARSFKILYLELIFLFSIIILQGFKILNFNLNDWVFGTITTSCLLQTFANFCNNTTYNTSFIS